MKSQLEIAVEDSVTDDVIMICRYEDLKKNVALGTSVYIVNCNMIRVRGCVGRVFPHDGAVGVIAFPFFGSRKAIW